MNEIVSLLSLFLVISLGYNLYLINNRKYYFKTFLEYNIKNVIYMESVKTLYNKYNGVLNDNEIGSLIEFEFENIFGDKLYEEDIKNSQDIIRKILEEIDREKQIEIIDDGDISIEEYIKEHGDKYIKKLTDEEIYEINKGL